MLQESHPPVRDAVRTNSGEAPRAGVGRILAVSVGALLLLAAVYTVAGLFTGRPTALRSGDAPQLEPLTGSEGISVTRSDHHSGRAATRISFPAEKAREGATFMSEAPAARRLRASLWVRGRSGHRYGLFVTQDEGLARAPSGSFVTTGDWQHLVLPVTLKSGDTVVHVVVYRQGRAGEETLVVDDVRVAAARR